MVIMSFYINYSLSILEAADVISCFRCTTNYQRHPSLDPIALFGLLPGVAADEIQQ